MSKRFPIKLSLFLVAVMFALSCQPAGQPGNQNSSGQPVQSWDAFVNDFLESHFAAHPDFAVGAGRHEFDGKLPDWSAEGLASEIKRLHAMKDRARAFADASLDERQRF